MEFNISFAIVLTDDTALLHETHDDDGNGNGNAAADGNDDDTYRNW
jgi:hypothetical protein